MHIDATGIALKVIYALGPLAIAVVLAVLTPLSIIMIRHEVRLRRIRAIDEFSRNFGFNQADGGGRNPSFEFVKTKYAVDIDTVPRGVDRVKLRSLDLSDPGVDDYLSNLNWYDLKSNRRILIASVLYMLVCCAGFMLTFAGSDLDYQGILSKFIGSSLILTGGLDAKVYGGHVAREAALSNAATVASIAFIGAYIFTLRLFLRAVSMFDLNAVTMLRAAVHVVMSVSVTLILYRAIPNPLSLTDSVWNSPSSGVPIGWFIAAFVFGFVPDTVLQFTFRAAGELTRMIKGADLRFQRISDSIPLDVIDGVDFFTRFRLEEANIMEVQNLATSNPIMLHIETPYGIYETIDWVAQAQLCTIVGQERFFLLRQMNARTIFDLERLVLSAESTQGLRRIIGAILLTPTKMRADVMAICDTRFSFPDVTLNTNLTPAQFDDKAVAAAGADDEYDRFIRHYVRVMVDDLHVVRLRKIWQDIGDQLTPGAQYLSDDYDHLAGCAGNPPEFQI